MGKVPKVVNDSSLMNKCLSLFNSECSTGLAEKKKDQPFVLYNRPHKSVIEDVCNETGDSLTEFRDENVLLSLEEITQAIKHKAKDELCCVNNGLLFDFISYLKPKLNNESMWTLCTHWPPGIKESQSQQSIFNILIMLITLSGEGNKVCYYLSRNLFEKGWFFTPDNTISGIVAYCKCYVGSSRSTRFAVLTNENIFRLYLLSEKGYIIEKETLISSIEVTRNGRDLAVNDLDGEVFVIFTPLCKNMADLWLRVSKGDHLSLANFFCSYAPNLPDFLLNVMYDALICSDTSIIRSILSDQVTPPVDIDCPAKLDCDIPPLPKNQSTILVSALFDIFTYCSRVSAFLSLACALSLESFELVSNFLRQPTNFGNLVNVIFERYGGPYYVGFGEKLLQFIKQNNCFSNPCKDMKATVGPFFTCLKYIYNSFDYVPAQTKHLLSIIGSQVMCKSNNVHDTYVSLASAFFMRFLTPMLLHPEIYTSDGTKSNKNVEGFISMLKVITVYGEFGFEELDSRLKSTIYMNIERFLFSFLSSPEPIYPCCTPSRLVEALDQVAHTIAYHHSDFMYSYGISRDKSILQLELMQINFEIFLANFYHFRYEKDMLRLAQSTCIDEDIKCFEFAKKTKLTNVEFKSEPTYYSVKKDTNSIRRKSSSNVTVKLHSQVTDKASRSIARRLSSPVLSNFTTSSHVSSRDQLQAPQNQPPCIPRPEKKVVFSRRMKGRASTTAVPTKKHSRPDPSRRKSDITNAPYNYRKHHVNREFITAGISKTPILVVSKSKILITTKKLKKMSSRKIRENVSQ